MITEDYVSFEVAKLLKEKGFNEPTFTYYNNDGDLMNSCNFCGSYTLGCFNNVKDKKVNCAAPTYQMALKWLREKRGIAVTPFISSILDNEKFLWNVEITVAKTNDTYHQGWIYEQYEEAVEKAIKYCLTNLI